MSHLEAAELAVFYFDPDTKAPITLMELGLAIGRGDNQIVVCCPEGYWRKGNVDVICDKYEITMLNSLEELSKHIRREFTEDYGNNLLLIEYYKGRLEDIRNGV